MASIRADREISGFTDGNKKLEVGYSHRELKHLLLMHYTIQVNHRRRDYVKDVYFNDHELRQAVAEQFYLFTKDVDNYYSLPALKEANINPLL